MWVFLTSRLRTWMIFAVALPLGTAVIRRIRRALEARSGQTPVVKGLTKLEDLGQRRRRQHAQTPTPDEKSSTNA